MTPSARFVTLATVVALFVLLVQAPREAQAGPAKKLATASLAVGYSFFCPLTRPGTQYP